MFKKGIMIFLLTMICFSTALYAGEGGNSEPIIETGFITGQLFIKDGGPLSSGMVVFFNGAEGPPPDPNEYLRIPDEIGELDPDGKFIVELPVGTYYVGGIKRMSGEKIGPPLDGDYFYLKRDKKGAPQLYTIKKHETVDLGISKEAIIFRRKIVKGVSGISGIVTDMKGGPIEGAIIFAYTSSTMTGLPPFTSYKTGKDGKYFIGTKKGGNYFLRIRDIYGGGPPVEGSVIGEYGEEEPAAVTVATGKVSSDVNIKVIRHFKLGPKKEDLERMEKAKKETGKDQIEMKNKGKYKPSSKIN